MENIYNVITISLEKFMGTPWYLKIILSIDFLAAIVVLFFMLVYFTEVAKTLFALDFAAICYLLYDSKGIPGTGGTVFGILLVAVLAILLFIIYIADDDGSGIVMTFLGSLGRGMVNLCIIFACVTIVLIPLGVMAWHERG